MIVLPDGGNRMIVASFVSTKHRNVTERQTDGGTDTPVAYTAVSIARYADALKQEAARPRRKQPSAFVLTLMLYIRLASPVAVCNIAIRGRHTQLAWLANPVLTLTQP